MAIQNRRGSYSSFNGGSGLSDGEFGIVMSGDPNTTDGTGTYIANTSGVIHRLLTDDDKTDLAGDIQDNADDISALNATLTSFSGLFSATPTSPTSYNSKANNINQGYIKVGKVVFVSVYFELASANTGMTQVLTGFPYPNGARNLIAMNLENNAVMAAYINTSGRISVTAASANDRITVMGVYFAQS